MAKTIVITGASSGIGAATSKKFLDSGWNVALLARRLDKLESTSKDYSNALNIRCDVTNENDVKDAFLKAKHHFGNIDALFNNAGIFPPGAPFDEIELDAWKASIDVNFTGMFICAREAFRHMKKDGGRIINNGSISAITPRPNSAAYSSTKHAITGLTKCIALDGREFNICCGQIDIGNAKTELLENLIKHSGDMPTMDVKDAADAVYNMAKLPLTTNVLSMTIMANQMEFVGRG